MSDQTQTWTEEMIQAWKDTRPIIISKLAQARRANEVEDVMSEVWIAAATGLDSFDPERGSFSKWINGIAYNQAARLVRAEAKQGSTVGDIAHAANSGVSTIYDVVAADHAATVDGQVSDWAAVSDVLRMVRAAVSERKLFDRSMRLILECNGDVALAGKQLGVAPAALRDSHRNVLDLARVVHKALSAYWRRNEDQVTRGVTIRDLLGCLPDESEESRAWIGVVARAVASAGGFGAVTAADVATMTGMAETTARHCLSRTGWLLTVARTVLETGDLK